MNFIKNMKYSYNIYLLTKIIEKTKILLLEFSMTCNTIKVILVFYIPYLA